MEHYTILRGIQSMLNKITINVEIQQKHYD